METVDPVVRKRTQGCIIVYGLWGVLGLFGIFMMRSYISEDLAREGVIAPGMVAITASMAATAAAGFFTAIQYWRDGGHGTHKVSAINWRCATMAFIGLTAASAAYAKYPLPLPTQADEIQGAISDIAVKDDDVVAKLNFRVAGRPFAYDCFHSKGDCTARDAILALANGHPRGATVIPVGSTVLSLVVDGRTIVDPAKEKRDRFFVAMIYLFWAPFLGIIAFGDWRGYAFFRKPLRPQTA